MTTTENQTPGGIRAGDWLEGTVCDSRGHGVVHDVYPYRCSPDHGCDRNTCPRSQWWVVRFLDGVEVTESSPIRPVGQKIIRSEP